MCMGKRFSLVAAMLLAAYSTNSIAAPRIGNATATQKEVTGTVDGSAQPLAKGSDIYSDEMINTGDDSVAHLLFLDKTNLSVGPTSEVKLDTFIYDPSGTSGSVVIQAVKGTFRFVTGIQDKKSYTLKTAYGTIGVRGTVLEIVLTPGATPTDNDGNMKVRLVEGGATVTSLTGQSKDMNEPNTVLTVFRDGGFSGPNPAPNSILNFAAGPTGPETTASLAPGSAGGPLNSSPLPLVPSSAAGNTRGTPPVGTGSMTVGSPPGVSGAVSPSR